MVEQPSRVKLAMGLLLEAIRTKDPKFMNDVQEGFEKDWRPQEIGLVLMIIATVMVHDSDSIARAREVEQWPKTNKEWDERGDG